MSLDVAAYYKPTKLSREIYVQYLNSRRYGQFLQFLQFYSYILSFDLYITILCQMQSIIRDAMWKISAQIVGQLGSVITNIHI